MRDTIVHNAKIEKPFTDEHGISDPVNVFTTNGMILVAWWDENDKYWYTIDGEILDVVKYWSSINFPTGWNYNSELYGGME